MQTQQERGSTALFVAFVLVVLVVVLILSVKGLGMFCKHSSELHFTLIQTALAPVLYILERSIGAFARLVGFF